MSKKQPFPEGFYRAFSLIYYHKTNYNPYGVPDTTPLEWAFTGEQRDSQTGLQLLSFGDDATFVLRTETATGRLRFL